MRCFTNGFSNFVAMKRLLLFIICSVIAIGSYAQGDTLTLVRVNKQRHFKHQVPAGNYSGITRIGKDEYAVVSDKSPKDGYYVFRITIDSIKGYVYDVQTICFRGVNDINRDAEGIVYLPQTNTLLISGEADNQIFEYQLDGNRTIRKVELPSILRTASRNEGLESLAYNEQTHEIWTCAESTLPEDGAQATYSNGIKNNIRLFSFDENLQPKSQYLYQMDAPKIHKKAYIFAHGVSELLALDNGSLLVLEREFYVPKKKIGSYVINRIYQVFPHHVLQDGNQLPMLDKVLLTEWKTKLNLLSRKIANYEGMCLGPKLVDGSQVIILVSDSQNQYGGVLKDWFKTIVVK